MQARLFGGKTVNKLVSLVKEEKCTHETNLYSCKPPTSMNREESGLHPMI